jgi:bla regulator protein blaR1
MLQYLLKLSISLTLVYLFYQLFLRRLTFYNWNRWYLLIYSIVCFVIPFVNVFTIIVNQPTLRESTIINYIPAITQISQPAYEKAVHINWMHVAIIVIIAGILIMIVRLLIQYYSLFKMRSKAVLLYDDKVKLYHIDEPVIPFSFGRGIYVNQHQHTEQELKEIIHHEFIHVKQRHSLDILWSELLCILNWYNPFAWLLRHDIRQNLEFIADQQVLQTGLDRKQYQYLLLKVIGVNAFSIATNFNFSSLKRRIAMMNKTKSARVHLIRFLFLLPLLVVILLAFRNTTQGHQQPVSGTVTDTIPNAAKLPPGWKDINTIDVTDEQKVTIRLKNGKMEKYDLTRPKEKETFESKYGSLPEPPAPPAAMIPSRNEKELPEVPEAPEAPEKLEARELPDVPEAPEAPERPEMREVPEAPEAPEIKEVPEVPDPPAIVLQDCLNKKGYCITVADNYGECIVIVKDKNNKIVEAVALTDWNKDKQFEDKYGEIPHRNIRIRFQSKPATSANGKPGNAVAVREEMVEQGRSDTPAEVEKVKSTMDVIHVKTVNGVLVVNKVPAKPVINIRLNPNPVKVIQVKPINKAETKPFSAEKATPVAANVGVSAKLAAQVKARSAVRLTIAQSAKSAAKVQVAAEPKAPQKPVAEQPENKL